METLIKDGILGQLRDEHAFATMQYYELLESQNTNVSFYAGKIEGLESAMRIVEDNFPTVEEK